jgi:SnoaL-like domain
VAEELLSWFPASYRQGSAAFNEGDFTGALGWLPEDIEWHAVSVDPETRVLRGPAEVIRYFEEFRAVFDDWRIEPISFERDEALAAADG